MSTFIKPIQINGLIVVFLDTNVTKDITDTLLRYKVKVIDGIISTIIIELKEATDEHRENILQKVMRLNALMKELEIKLNKEV